MKRLLFSIIAISCLFTASAEKSTKELTDSIEIELSRATSINDSIRLYYDLFDLTTIYGQKSYAEKILDLALRAEDEKSTFNILRRLIHLNIDNEPDRLHYEALIKNLKPSHLQFNALMYAKFNNTIQAVRDISNPTNKERIDSLILTARQQKGASIYTRLEVLFALGALLEDQSQMKQLTRYTEMTDSILELFENHIPDIDNFFLTQSADNYAAVGDNAKSIEADIRMLNILDSLETRYHEAGRKYYNNDLRRFRSYARILSNYEALSTDSIDYFYNLIQDIAKKHGDQFNTDDYMKLKRSEIYYLMTKGRYKEVIPLIEDQLATKQQLQFHILINMVNRLIEASTMIGDMETRDKAFDTYHQIMEQNRAERGRTVLIELQTVYENNTLNIQEANFKTEQNRMRHAVESEKDKTSRILILASLIIVLILIAVIIAMVITQRRMKRMAKRAIKDNDALVEERDTLRRTQAELVRAGEQARSADRQREQFINNVSNEFKNPVNAIVEYSRLIVDCIDDDKHRYLDRLASVVKLNAELLTMLINDVLDVASHDKGTLKIDKRPVSLHDICTVAIDTMKDHVNQDVEVVNDIKNQPDILIETDPKRVAQVLINLLSNAAKFTNKGKITLSGSISDDSNTYSFTVTDTGIGIPLGREEEVFQRFKKLNKYSQGVGLGLPVSRLIARLLGGDVVIDREYKGPGTRFIFSLSIR